MLTGEKSTFAIECDICKRGEDFIYCHFRFWIMGSPIGNWHEESVLGVLAHSAGVISKYEGNRYLAQADNLSAIDLWDHITKVCDSDDPINLQTSLEGRYRQKFLLHELADDAVATVCEVAPATSHSVTALAIKRKRRAVATAARISNTAPSLSAVANYIALRAPLAVRIQRPDCAAHEGQTHSVQAGDKHCVSDITSVTQSRSGSRRSTRVRSTPVMSCAPGLPLVAARIVYAGATR